MNSIYKLFLGFTLLATLATSCATHKASGENAQLQERDHLAPSERRLFDYLYLEGEQYRLQKQDDAAFDLYRQAALIDTLNAPVKYQLANYLVQLNQPLVAIDYLRDAVAIEPDNFWYSSMLGSLLQHMQQYDEAIAVYESTVEKHPKQIQICYMLAEVYGTKGDIPQSIATLNRIEEVMGKSEDISITKYRLYQSQGDEANAFAEIEELAATYPSQATYQLLLGELYLGVGRTEEALAAYNKAEELAPNSGYVLVAKSTYYKTVGDYEAQQELAYKILLKNDVDIETKLQLLVDHLATVLKEKSDLAPIYSIFASLTEMHPTSMELRNLYTRFLLAEDDYDLATQQLQQIVAIEPTNLEYWMQLMGTQLQLEVYRDMINTGKEALEFHADKLGVYFYMGLAATQLEEYAEAIGYIEQGIAIAPTEQTSHQSDLYGQIGDIYHQWGKQEETYKAYDKALELNPNNVSVLNNYSYFLSLDKEELRKAEKMSGRAVELEPTNATFLDTYAWIFFQQENYMLAKIYLQSALTYGGDSSAEIVEHFGDVLFMTDDTEKAIEYWEKALLLNEGSEILKQKINEQRYIAP